MASSSTEICNLAISHLGTAKEISDIDEKTAEANACRRFFDEALKECLADFRWPFATSFETLALVAEDPNTEWSYSYRYPSGCLFVRKILSGVRNDTEDTGVPYKIGRDSAGLLIYTDMAAAAVEVTTLVTDPLQNPAQFTMAFSYLLASYIAPRITGGDPFKMGPECLQKYQVKIAMAKARALNEERQDVDYDSELIRSRN